MRIYCAFGTKIRSGGPEFKPMEIVDSGSNQNKIAVRSLKWEAWKSLVSMYFTLGIMPLQCNRLTPFDAALDSHLPDELPIALPE